MSSTTDNTTNQSGSAFSPQHTRKSSQRQPRLTATWANETNRLVCKWTGSESPAMVSKTAVADPKAT